MLVGCGAVHAGVEFAERALALNGGFDVSAEFGRLVKSLILAAEYDLARRYLHVVRGMIEPERLELEFVAFTTILDYVQYQVVSTQAVMAALAERSASDPEDCARVLCICVVALLEKWELPAARALVREAVALVGSEADVTAATLEVLDLYTRAFEGRSLPSTADMLPFLDVVRKFFGRETSRILLARALVIGERYADARELLNNVIEQAAGVPRIWTDFARQVQFSNELKSGRYHRARAVFEVIEAGGSSRRSFPVNRALMAAAIFNVDGNADAAAEVVREATRMVAQGKSPAQEALIAVRQGRIALMTRDLGGAARHFARARSIGVDLGNPQLLRIHGDYVETLVGLGKRDLAFEVLEELRVSSDRTPSAWAHLTVRRCTAQLLEGEEAIRALAELLESWTDGEYVYLRARTLFVYAEILKQLGYEKRCVEAKQEALDIFHEIGVGSGNDICTNGEATVVSSSSLLDLLDYKELPVVRLLARGYKNQSIAHELFVSVRTVELRLTSVYRKFDVKSRFELMERVAGEFKDE